MTVTIAERLDASRVFDENGDVRDIADAGDLDLTAQSAFPMKNEARIARMKQPDPHESDIDAYYAEQDAASARDNEMKLIRLNGDFSDRNIHLSRMSRKVGKLKQHEGAVSALEDGRFVNGYANSPEIAERAAVNAKAAALELGSKACAACSLREFCSITPEELAQELKDAQARSRFGKRVAKLNNDHLCETNLSAGRLREDVT